MIKYIRILFFVAFFMGPFAGFAFEGRVSRRAAFDVGSGRTKILIADIDPNDHRIIKVIHSEFIRLKFSDDLAKNQSDELSQSIQDHAVELMKRFKCLSEDYGVEKCSGIATEVFRKAKNGKEVLRCLEQVLNTSLRVISQADEAELGLMSLCECAGMDINQLVAIDQGAGSFQVTSTNENIVSSYGGQLGVISVTEALLKVQGKSYSDLATANPVSLENTFSLMNYLGEAFGEPPEWLQKKLCDPAVIVGGLSDVSSALGVCSCATKKRAFTQNDIWKIIQDSLEKTDAELKSFFPQTTASTLLPRLIFAYSLMKKLKIENICWFESNGGLATGVLTDPSFWEIAPSEAAMADLL